MALPMLGLAWLRAGDVPAVLACLCAATLASALLTLWRRPAGRRMDLGETATGTEGGVVNAILAAANSFAWAAVAWLVIAHSPWAVLPMGLGIVLLLVVRAARVPSLLPGT